MLLLLASAAALAGEDACQACCRASGLSGCIPALEVYSDGSRPSREAGSWQLRGLWRLSCGEAGVFDPNLSARVGRAPLGGEIVTDGGSAVQIECFRQACGLPPGVCLSPADEDGRYFLVECGSGLPADASLLSLPPPG